jgi:hypothetical protein
MAITRWQQAIDQNGLPIASGIPQSNTISTMHFTAAGVKTQGIPAGANLVLIERTGGADLMVSLSGTAAAPAADNDVSSTSTSSGQEANPVGKWLYGATQISIYAYGAADVTLSYFA